MLLKYLVLVSLVQTALSLSHSPATVIGKQTK